jgi:hypothetical protein
MRADPILLLWSFSFMLEMMRYPDMMRNVVVAGHLHHGKTSLLDMLIHETHQMTIDVDQPVSRVLLPCFRSVRSPADLKVCLFPDALHGHARPLARPGYLYQVVAHVTRPP